MNNLDLISKADAIGSVIEVTTYLDMPKAYCERLIDGIKALPSAEAEQGEWIPIKDGLPKLYKDVMATVWFEDDGDDDDAFEIAFGFLNKFGKWHLKLADGSECIKGFYVQAWRPLPKPYIIADAEIATEKGAQNE